MDFDSSKPTPGTSGSRPLSRRLRHLMRLPGTTALRELATLCVVSAFLLLYRLVPAFGGDQLGLVGADEPRYAQIAR